MRNRDAFMIWSADGRVYLRVRDVGGEKAATLALSVEEAEELLHRLDEERERAQSQPLAEI